VKIGIDYGSGDFTRAALYNPATKEMTMGMNFSQALDEIKAGKRLCRGGWNGQGMFVFLVPGSNFKVNREPLLSILGEGSDVTYRPHIDLCDVSGTVGVWQPSMGDVMADDWFVVPVTDPAQSPLV